MKKTFTKSVFPKRIVIVTIIIATLLSLGLLTSCSPKPEKCGEGYIDQKMFFEFSDEVLEAVYPIQKSGGAAFGRNVAFASYYSAKTAVEIYNRYALPDNAVYSVKDYENVQNAVVTSKWMYLYSLYENRDVVGVYVTDFNVANSIISDEYCMERVNLNPISLINKASYAKGDASDYDKPLYSLTDKKGLAESVIMSEPLCYKYCGELTAAALYRYGAIGFDSSRMGKLNLYSGQDDAEPYLTLNVVGYVETEADRLLSTGVSMDENSSEYKTVIAQLSNPVFYSVNDKFANG